MHKNIFVPNGRASQFFDFIDAVQKGIAVNVQLVRRFRCAAQVGNIGTEGDEKISGMFPVIFPDFGNHRG